MSRDTKLCGHCGCAQYAKELSREARKSSNYIKSSYVSGVVLAMAVERVRVSADDAVSRGTTTV